MSPTPVDKVISISGYPEATELPLTNKGYIDVDGGKLFYQTFGKNKAGTPIIVVHGGPGLDQGYLLPPMLELARNNQVSFYDQRGSGKSLCFKLDKHHITMDIFIADLEAMRKKLGYEKFILLGHSWGGLLGIKYATLYPERIAALIFMDSAPATASGYTEFINSFNSRIEPLALRLHAIQSSDKFKHGDSESITQLFRTLFTAYCYSPNAVEQLVLQFTAESYLDGSKVAEIFDEGYLTDYDLKLELQKLQLPVLIIHGDHDVVPLTTAQEIAALIPGAQLVVLENCGHFPFIEKPVELFAALKRFLAAN
jgi:proline iminopeptidase